jgi:hypothetical protein
MTKPWMLLLRAQIADHLAAVADLFDHAHRKQTRITIVIRTPREPGLWGSMDAPDSARNSGETRPSSKHCQSTNSPSSAEGIHQGFRGTPGRPKRKEIDSVGEGEAMKVIAYFKDGSKREVPISEIDELLQVDHPGEAIALAKQHFTAEELERVSSWEVEEEFL